MVTVYRIGAGMNATEPWPAKTRAEAIAVAIEHDATVAEEATGVPAATVRQWLKRSLDLVRPHLPAELQSVRSWREALPLLLDAIGVVLVNTIVALDEAVEKRDHRAARDFAVVLGVLVEKGQLVSGGATHRSESASIVMRGDDVKAEIARLEAMRSGVVEVES